MRIALLGGRGFFGEAVANKLSNHEVITIDRNTGSSYHRQADITEVDSLTEAFSGVDVVVNFVGLSPLKQPPVPYSEIHVEGVKNVLRAAKKNHIPYLVHISALGADEYAPTEYLRTKARGETQLDTFTNKRLIVRPSVLFDTHSEFIETFTQFSWTRMFPNLTAQLQPVYRQDIAEWIAQAIQEQKTGVYEIAGPHIINITDLAELLYLSQGDSMLRLPSWTAHLGATILAKLPSTRITRDQVRSLDLQNILLAGSTAKQIVCPTSLFDWVLQQT